MCLLEERNVDLIAEVRKMSDEEIEKKEEIVKEMEEEEEVSQGAVFGEWSYQ